MKAEDAMGIVAGIDIGGDKKGCHLVVLRGTEILCCLNSREPERLARACVEFDASVVGVDSPCRWGIPDAGRAAEKQLARERIFSFSTPPRERAQANASGFYGWMFNGERVYQALAETHPLLPDAHYSGGRVSFETFPHAITCAMLGIGVASAKRKRHQRRQLLEEAGVATSSLKSIDAVDAALCALTGTFLLKGKTAAYGDGAGGYILVPDIRGAVTMRGESKL
jgi:predicted nuclease with RNAse H fold